MELKQVKELMASMGQLEIDKLSWRQGETHLQLERSTGIQNAIATPLDCSSDKQNPPTSQFASSAQKSTALPAQHLNEGATGGEGKSVVGEWIFSPMVGTLYLTPGPDSPPFVKVGDVVGEQSVVCIVEAMKVMNEIRASCVGRVVEIPLQSESSVEYGTQLMRIVRS